MNLMIKYNYKNFFEWYKEEHEKWKKENPNDMFDCGISKEIFKYLILLYLYKGPITASDYEKLKWILKHHSSRYKKEVFYANFLHKDYKPKCKDSFDEYTQGLIQNFTILFNDKWTDIPDDLFVKYCEHYLDGIWMTDSISTSQYDLNSLHDILIKHSKRFKIEKYLYKLFK